MAQDHFQVPHYILLQKQMLLKLIWALYSPNTMGQPVICHFTLSDIKVLNSTCPWCHTIKGTYFSLLVCFLISFYSNAVQVNQLSLKSKYVAQIYKHYFQGKIPWFLRVSMLFLQAYNHKKNKDVGNKELLARKLTLNRLLDSLCMLNMLQPRAQ